MLAAALLMMALPAATAAKHGVVEFDHATFDKIVDGSRHTLVQFSEYTYGGAKDFDNVGKHFAQSDVLVTKLACKEWDSGNEEWCKDKQGVSSFPVTKLYPKGQKGAPLEYSGEDSAEAMIQWVESAVKPELKQIATLVKESIKDSSCQKDAGCPSRKKLDALAAHVDTLVAQTAVSFSKLAAKVSTKGDDAQQDTYIDNEKKRLSALIDNKATVEDKKKAFQSRLATIQSFEVLRKIATKGDDYPKTEHARLQKLVDNADTAEDKKKELKQRMSLLQRYSETPL